jgi:hypothetical protein
MPTRGGNGGATHAPLPLLVAAGTSLHANLSVPPELTRHQPTGGSRVRGWTPVLKRWPNTR